MKIVIDGRFYGLEHAGLGRYTVSLVDELKKLDKSNKYSIILRKEYFNSLKLPENWKKILFDVRHYSLKEQLLLPTLLYKEKPDIFHSLQINLPLLYFGKSIVTVHDTTQLEKSYEATTLPMPLYLIKLIALRLIFRLKVKSAKKIIVPTQKVKKDLIGKGIKENKISVIYEGIDNSFFISGNALNKSNIGKDPYFIYVGSAYPHKNIERAIEAICLINKSDDRKIKLKLISARNSFSQKLTKYINEVKAEDFVELIGYVSDDELVSQLKYSTGFVYPSLTEGFGLPGLEAMAVGTPLLASRIPVFKEVYDDCAIFFDSLDATAISDAMEYVLGLKKKERKLLIAKAKEHAMQFSWEKMAKETLNLYQSL